MKSFTVIEAVAAPILRENIDTDVIIRIDRLVGNDIRGKLAPWCFGSLRYLADGSEDPEFVLNREPYRQAQIIITGRNFGCGSSREGAVWSLVERGVVCVIAPSFGDIFFNNCFQNGVLPVELDQTIVDDLASEVLETQGVGKVRVDLIEQAVVSPSGRQYGFVVEPRRRDALLQGLDEIGMTLRSADAITAFQTRDKRDRPWVYAATGAA